MAPGLIVCPYCKRDDFVKSRGLTQHQQKNPTCNRLMKAALGVSTNRTNIAHSFLRTVAVNRTYGRNLTGGVAQTIARIRQEPAQRISETRAISQTDRQYAQQPAAKAQKTTYLTETEEYEADEDDANFLFMGDDDDSSEGLSDEGSIAPVVPKFIPHLGKTFQEYMRYAQQSYIPFTKYQARAVRLLIRLRKTRAPLHMYDGLMEWYLQETGAINYRQTASDSGSFISKNIMFKLLKKRYNFDPESHGKISKLTLPHSKAKVNIACNDPKMAIISLLTDPRIKDEDYLFWNNDPLATPPLTPQFVQDLNTGTSCASTYADLIKSPGKQVLLPVIFYIDGANTGQFADLPITAVKISLGIFTRKARDKDYMWRTIGYTPTISNQKSRGKRIMIDSNHFESIMAHPDALEDEGEETDNTIFKAQDLHTMLAEILRNYVQLQDSGFYWDLHYNGKIYKDIEFVMYTPFFKVDGDEAEKLCGKYTSRGANVAQLCRYCECPTDETDNPKADYNYKTKTQIKALTDAKKEDELQQMSQQVIQNATHKLRLGSQNDRGIHGACPMEMLHATLLGMFKYVRDCLFQQMGPTSQLAASINALAQKFGELLSRQSDRDLPKTRFNKGIARGKLMAKEFPGILLCMAAVLRSTEGRRLLTTKKPGTFKQKGVLKDWTLLVETLLQWEIWLKADEMERKHVELARYKHRHIMYFIKKVIRRVEGMGLKISKFHGISHMADDILQFGIPMEFDTGSCESGHKATKVAAKLTQKNAETFDQQTATRLAEMQLLELAEQELQGKYLWNYGNQPKTVAKEKPFIEKEPIGGSKYLVYYDDESEQYLAADTSRSKRGKKIIMEKGLIDFVGGLQEKVSQHICAVPIRTEHARKGQMFRAHPRYREHVWRDWVIVDWEEEGLIPNKIWGFVDLRELPHDCRLMYGGIELEPGIFGIVENCVVTTDEDELRQSELFYPITKEVGGLTLNNVSHLTFYLADVEAFVKPVAVIPDLGGPPNGYFALHERATWKKMFTDWLELPREEGEMDD